MGSVLGVEVGGGGNLFGEVTLGIGGILTILVSFPVIGYGVCSAIGVSSGDIVYFGMSFCGLSVSSSF